MSVPSITPTYHHKVYPAIDISNPELSAEGKVVLVTGGGRGIGKEIALTFARAGAKAVVLLGRSESTLQSAVQEIKSLNTTTSTAYFVADVSDSPSVLAAFAETKSQFGSIDVVVANSGYLPDMLPIKDADVNEFWKGYEVNVKGLFITTQAFVRTAEPGATLISLTTAVAHIPPRVGASAYSSSKLAAAKFIEDAQAEHPEFKFFNIHPGVVDTEMARKGTFTAQDDVQLPASFSVWLASPKSNPLKGKFIWANWDVEELLARQEEINSKNLLTTGLKGWGYTVV
jgi:NAD(P)-dependent dehydrogenase (short-subunit alcohol dehydrogenase family)